MRWRSEPPPVGRCPAAASPRRWPGGGAGRTNTAPSCTNTRRNRVGHGRDLAKAPTTRYNRGMSMMVQPLAAEPAATTPAPEPAHLLEELATLHLENAALCA